MNIDTAKLPSADIWVIDSVRFTIFLTDDNKPSGLSSWWEALTGHDDKSVSYDRHRLVHVETGVLNPEDEEQALFQLSWSPGKVNMRILPNQEKELPPTELYNLGPLRPRLEEMGRIVKAWSSTAECPNSSRLALGTTLLHSVPSKEDGYEKLSPFLREYITLDPDSSDFRYQINRRRQSKSRSDLGLNRLSQWLVWGWQRSSLQIDLVENSVSREDLSGSPQFAVRADLDINTVPDDQLVLDCSQYVGIYDELAELAAELAQKGDHK